MLTSAALPLPQVSPVAPLPLSPQPQEADWEHCESVCQLPLMRMVGQGWAAAGWLIYDDGEDGVELPSRQVVVSAGATAAVPNESFLTSTAFLYSLTYQAVELPLEIDGFCHRLAEPEGWIYGLRFPVFSMEDRAYLLLWRRGAVNLAADGRDRAEPLTLGMEMPDLLADVGMLQAAIRLDRTHQRQRRRIDGYQTILRGLEHQLRHPLAMIHLYAANLQHGLTQDRDRQQAQTIREAVGHLNDHLTDLIAGCQRSHVRTGVCSIPDLWAEAWQGLRLMAQDKAVSLRLADHPLTLCGDRAQLIQAFTNLLHNALCFSPPQGQISAQWQVYRQEAVITLADQGPGLSPADLQHLFRPYYSNRPQGSGIGLTIARQIVQQHGGKLWAENLPQGGAQFSMVLPLSST